MRLFSRLSIAIAGVGAFCTLAVPANASPTDKAAIVELEKQFTEAVKSKDINKIMSYYAPDESLVVFDVSTPRQYVGWKAYKDDWQEAIDLCSGPIDFEISDVAVVAADSNIAFGHSIQHYACTRKDGGRYEFTMRVTDGYENRQGKWLIAHEHGSVPVDFKTFKPDMTSKP